jgi:hypothetical protein
MCARTYALPSWSDGGKRATRLRESFSICSSVREMAGWSGRAICALRVLAFVSSALRSSMGGCREQGRARVRSVTLLVYDLMASSSRQKTASGTSRVAITSPSEGSANPAASLESLWALVQPALDHIMHGQPTENGRLPVLDPSYHMVS